MGQKQQKETMTQRRDSLYRKFSQLLETLSLRGFPEGHERVNRNEKKVWWKQWKRIQNGKVFWVEKQR